METNALERGFNLATEFVSLEYSNHPACKASLPSSLPDPALSIKKRLLGPLREPTMVALRLTKLAFCFGFSKYESGSRICGFVAQRCFKMLVGIR
jgi:hypothetical protein